MDLADFNGISAHDATRIRRRVKRMLERRKAPTNNNDVILHRLADDFRHVRFLWTEPRGGK
ncbi:hypothetical protein GCM10017635_18930 [Paracoccus kondratievae]|uniref:Uncharacterized protein n=1 Tax=Paracoccus kondratievae TaxID=135740 RepID=A0AAD3NYS6_9RHOB|nr:hypothetical protein GCM10017635_18930 [Paracoccus kondratievae]